MTHIKELYNLKEEEIDDKADVIANNNEKLISEYREGELSSEELVDLFVDKIDEGGVKLVMTCIGLAVIARNNRKILFDKYPDIIDKLMIDDETIYLTKNILHQTVNNYDYTDSTEEMADILSNIIDDISSYYNDNIRENFDDEIPRGGATMMELAEFLQQDQDELKSETGTFIISDIQYCLKNHVSFFIEDNNKKTKYIINSLWEKKENNGKTLGWGIDSNLEISNDKKSEEVIGGVEYEDIDIFESRLIIAFHVAILIITIEKSPEDILRIESSLVEYLKS